MQEVSKKESVGVLVHNVSQGGAGVSESSGPAL